jgi:hypothetical protein
MIFKQTRVTLAALKIAKEVIKAVFAYDQVSFKDFAASFRVVSAVASTSYSSSS